MNAEKKPDPRPHLKFDLLYFVFVFLAVLMIRDLFVGGRFLMSRTELMNRMAVLLGGRAAEILVFDEASTGAADDLVKATDIARDMVVRFGMTAELGQVAYETEPATFLTLQAPGWRPRSYSDGTAEAIDHAVKTLVDQAFKHATETLERNRSLLDSSASALLAKETLSKDDIAAIGKQVRAEPSLGPPAITAAA